jgi:hypothetical protein
VIPFLSGYSAQEWPEPFSQLRVQHRRTLFGAEDTMNIERAKGATGNSFDDKYLWDWQ